MLIPLAARSRSSPLPERRKTRFSISRMPQTAHAVESSSSREEKPRAVRERRINSHFTRVFANFKGNRRGRGKVPTTPDCFNIFCLPACLLACLLLEGVPVPLGNRKHKRGAIFFFFVLVPVAFLFFPPPPSFFLLYFSSSFFVLFFSSLNVARQLEYFRAFERYY